MLILCGVFFGPAVLQLCQELRAHMAQLGKLLGTLGTWGLAIEESVGTPEKCSKPLAGQMISWDILPNILGL
jgi:hypothetical protein